MEVHQCKIHLVTYTEHENMSNIIYRYGTDINPVLIEDVDCSSSSYLVLLQCSYSTLISSYCNDNDHDVYVVCCK